MNDHTQERRAWPERAHGVECVVCPDCAFTFDIGHEDMDGGWSCPACAELELRDRLEAAERYVDQARADESLAHKRATDAEARVARLTARLEERERMAAQIVSDWRASAAAAQDSMETVVLNVCAETLEEHFAASPGEPGRERSRGTLPGGDLGGPRPAGVRRCQADNPHEPHDHFPDGAVRYRCPGEPETQEPGGVWLEQRQVETLREAAIHGRPSLFDLVRSTLPAEEPRDCS